MSESFKEIIIASEPGSFLPDASFAHGIHLLFVQSRAGWWHGTGWVNGEMQRCGSSDREWMERAFIAKHGTPATLRIFNTQAEAHAAYPKFYL